MNIAKNEQVAGGFYAFFCYLIWGIFPLYFLLTAPATPLEIVAGRVLFSLLFCLVLLPFTRQVKSLVTVLGNLGQVGLLFVASLLIFGNWLLYVIATTSNNVMEASLGYYINPIVSVALGVVFLGERLRPLQWAGIGIAVLAVLVMVVFYGSVPWLGLGLAFTFGFYGLVKKRIGAVPALVSLTLETLLLTPLAAVLMWYFALSDQLTLLAEGPAHFWILAASGVITAVPLLLFAGAAARIPLSVLGMVQYVGPTLQFLLALFVTQEHLSAGRWAGFVLIWVAAAFFITDSLLAQRRARAQQPSAPLISPDTNTGMLPQVKAD
ncbi:MAG: EamA family transporter RarD [Rothia sp. (in: high G+C Gram-positive bacteria)]|uniref:EamA family transporter RarD n=1 Tax=Rothia sp. (in: high G+C Gram-positive bacteria) TaxID=1885016 RepID=UPI0027066B3D|nr:EamA family transporter RarD [Rothia sp. (in: high G+C Gram-positive bacteria)]